MGEAKPPADKAVIIPVGIAGAPPEAGRDRRQDRFRRQAHCLLEVPILVAAERGIGIHPFGLQRHPVGPHIAFLKHMDAHLAQRRNAPRRDMVRPAIAEQQQIRHAVLAQILVEEGWPVRKPAAKVHVGIGPVAQVAAAEVDPTHRQPAIRHDFPQAPEQRPGRTLKEQERALFRHHRQPRARPCSGRRPTTGLWRWLDPPSAMRLQQGETVRRERNAAAERRPTGRSRRRP